MASTASSKRYLALLCLLSPALATAGDWKFTSGLSLSERYSDNTRLGAGGQARSDWITELSPHVSVRREGARLKVNADYNLQGLLYANNSDSNRLRHHLNGRAHAELVDELFFLDASARISHVLNDLANSSGLGDAVGIGNTTSVGAYSLSPYLKHRFGSFATVEARVARDGVFIGSSGVSDTATTRYSLSAVSGNEFLPLTWGANYSKTENNTSNSALAQDSSSERAAVNARYQLSRKYGLLAQAGMEKNDFTGVSTAVRDYSYAGLGAFYTPSRYFSMDVYYNTSDNGDFLSGNVTLSPTVRTSINASASQRAYGRSYGLNLSHRARHSNWSLRYQDDLTTSQQQFQGGGFGCTDPNLLPSDPACIPVPFSQTQINQTYLSKNLIGTVNYTLRRNTFTLSLYNNQREFQGNGNSDTTRGLQGSWSLKPAARTTFTLTGGMSQVESSVTTNRSDDLWNIGLSATHQFQPKLTGSLEVRHQERQSNQPNGDYSENSLAARVNMSF